MKLDRPGGKLIADTETSLRGIIGDDLAESRSQGCAGEHVDSLSEYCGSVQNRFNINAVAGMHVLRARCLPFAHELSPRVKNNCELASSKRTEDEAIP